MRFIAAILISALLLGSVAWSQFFLTRRVSFDITREADSHEHVDTHGREAHTYRLEVVPTFAAAHDPFAIQSDAGDTPTRLLVRHGEHALLKHTADIQRGERIVAPGLALQGDSARLYVQATPSADDAQVPCALRVRLYRDDGALCAESTIWSEGAGAQVSGEVLCGLTPMLESVDRGLGGERE